METITLRWVGIWWGNWEGAVLALVAAGRFSVCKFAGWALRVRHFGGLKDSPLQPFEILQNEYGEACGCENGPRGVRTGPILARGFRRCGWALSNVLSAEVHSIIQRLTAYAKQPAGAKARLI